MKIDILDSDFVRLKALAEPFIDTPGSVISKLLDAYEGVQVAPTVPTQISRENVFSLEDMPPLTHAKIMGGHFAGKAATSDEFELFINLLLGWVAERAKATSSNSLATAYETVSNSARITNAYNLDRRQAVVEALVTINDALKAA